MSLRGSLRRMIRHESEESGPDAEAALDVARYKYLLRVASPRVFDVVHAEVFAQLPVDTRDAVYRRLCRDLPEEHRPTSPDPTELARAAGWAQDDDPAYLLRMFRRPGDQSDDKPHSGSHKQGADTTLYAASVLSAAARTAAASPAAAETLLGFDTSLEAAQVNPTFSVRRSDGGVDRMSPPPAGWAP